MTGLDEMARAKWDDGTRTEQRKRHPFGPERHSSGPAPRADVHQGARADRDQDADCMAAPGQQPEAHRPLATREPSGQGPSDHWRRRVPHRRGPDRFPRGQRHEARPLHAAAPPRPKARSTAGTRPSGTAAFWKTASSGANRKRQSPPSSTTTTITAITRASATSPRLTPASVAVKLSWLNEGASNGKPSRTAA